MLVKPGMSLNNSGTIAKLKSESWSRSTKAKVQIKGPGLPRNVQLGLPGTHLIIFLLRLAQAENKCKQTGFWQSCISGATIISVNPHFHASLTLLSAAHVANKAGWQGTVITFIWGQALTSVSSERQSIPGYYFNPPILCTCETFSILAPELMHL